MKKLPELFRTKYVELTTAIVVIIIGIILATFSKSGGWQSLAGAALGSFGGALLSWSVATVNSREQAVEVLRPELELISRHLATSSGQIAHAVSDVRNKQMNEVTGFALVYQVNNEICVSVHDIQLLAGSRLDSKPLFETSDIIDELGEKLYAFSALTAHEGESATSTAASKELVGEVQNLLKQAKSSVETATPQRRIIKEAVFCPVCNGDAHAALGTFLGDSSHAPSPDCGAEFHLHHGTDCAVFSNRVGAHAPVNQV